MCAAAGSSRRHCRFQEGAGFRRSSTRRGGKPGDSRALEDPTRIARHRQLHGSFSPTAAVNAGSASLDPSALRKESGVHDDGDRREEAGGSRSRWRAARCSEEHAVCTDDQLELPTPAYKPPLAACPGAVLLIHAQPRVPDNVLVPKASRRYLRNEVGTCGPSTGEGSRTSKAARSKK